MVNIPQRSISPFETSTALRRLRGNERETRDWNEIIFFCFFTIQTVHSTVTWHREDDCGGTCHTCTVWSRSSADHGSDQTADPRKRVSIQTKPKHGLVCLQRESTSAGRLLDQISRRDKSGTSHGVKQVKKRKGKKRRKPIPFIYFLQNTTNRPCSILKLWGRC